MLNYISGDVLIPVLIACSVFGIIAWVILASRNLKPPIKED
jgi:hypothetical protein